MPNEKPYDDLIVGTGMAGLTVGALLANEGRRVLMLEAHDSPGGYAHTFAMGDYRFCAQVHYIFGCGEGEPVYELFERLGLSDEVRFVRLDPEGFDHVVVAGERFRIPNGFPKLRDRLIRRFPEAAVPLRRYFKILVAISEELSAIPDEPGLKDFVTAPVRFHRSLRYQGWTLQRLYDHVKMPPRLQAILAGQSGDYLLPPEEVSLLLHVALCAGYDRGAYYPEKHFGHMIGALVSSIRKKAGCDVLLEHEVERILVQDGRAHGAQTKNGKVFHAGRVISNADPRITMDLVGRSRFPDTYRRKLGYAYSSGNYTLYLGVKGLDLRDYGFGSYNVWHYPHDDLNRIYRDLTERNDFKNPWLFLSTPTLHTDAPGLAPEGHQVLEAATSCSYSHFQALRKKPGREYTQEKLRIRNRILDILEEQYVPNLRKHLAMRVAGTPLTNERYVWAPMGNAYGAALTPAHVRWPRLDHQTPVENLFIVNATAGYPSIGGTAGAGLRLFERLKRAG